MTDRIELRAIRVLGTHGVLAEEQVRAQPFEIDLEVEVDLRAAGKTDELTATLDYAALVSLVERVVSTERHALLERLAERIAEEVRGDERVASVTVTVRKLRPPVPVHIDTAGVRITRP